MTMIDAPIHEAVAVGDVRHEYAARRYDRLPDAQLIGEVASHLSLPRHDPADSFVLHAPLELAARAALLPHVLPEHRELARLRLVSLMTHFDASGPAIVETRAEEFVDVDSAASRLVDAVDRGELDDVDRAARWLGRAAKPFELSGLIGDDMIVRLSAAAHGPIFLYQLPRVAPRGEITGELLRGLARELARYPDWRLNWLADRPAGPPASLEQSPSADALFDAIAEAPASTPPDVPFIFPLMSTVDANGVAAGALAEVTTGDDIAARGRALLRAAAWSMLLEPDDHAPYGWSHCLTMPQAVLGIADTLSDPSLALAVASTYVVGFRSSLSEQPLRPVSPPALDVGVHGRADSGGGMADAISEGRAAAASFVWHAPDGALARIATTLATNAATGHDAHLVKYTLACMDVAAADPAHRRLFLASAATLAAWWSSHGDPDDPLRT